MDLDSRKFFSKYKSALIVILGYYVLLLCLSYYVSSNELFDDPIYLTPLIPSNDMYVQVNLILLVFVPISSVIGGLVGGYLLGPILLFLHKSIFGAKYSYWIQERPKSKTFGAVFRGYFPALLTINILPDFHSPINGNSSSILQCFSLLFRVRMTDPEKI